MARPKLIWAPAALALLCAPHLANAFNDLHQFHGDAAGLEAGASQIWGTGSAADWGITCAHCHIDAPGMIDLDITASPSLAAGSYTPGQIYDVSVSLVGDSLGGAQGLNTFALAIMDEGGQRAGDTLGTAAGSYGSANCKADPPGGAPGTVPATVVFGNCNAVVSTPVKGATSWSFQWTAPQAGTGTVTFHYGAVDGNGTTNISSLDDDVVVGTLALDEG